MAKTATAPSAAAVVTPKHAPKQLPGAKQRLLPIGRRPDRRGTGDRQEGADLHGDEGPADHQQVLVRRCLSLRAAAVFQGAADRRPGLRRLWLRRRQPEAVRLRRHGAGPRRRLFLHVLRRPQRSGDGLDLSRRFGGAEAEMAAADGALREDRLLRPDRTPGRLGNGRWADDHGQARRRHLGAQRPEALDRQRHVVRRLDHLGPRCRRQPGQGLHRREQDDARLQRREDRAQDRPQGRPERPDHAEGRPDPGSESACRAAIPSATRRACCG